MEQELQMALILITHKKKKKKKGKKGETLFSYQRECKPAFSYTVTRSYY